MHASTYVVHVQLRKNAEEYKTQWMDDGSRWREERGQRGERAQRGERGDSQCVGERVFLRIIMRFCHLHCTSFFAAAV